MPHQETSIRAAGGWLALASFLLAGVLAFHGPLAHDLDEQMRVIAAAATRWAVIHWIAAVALSAFAVAGLIVLSGGTRLTRTPWTISAWAVLTIGALWTATTAVVEVTVVAGAAASGNREVFGVWWAFAEGKAAGFCAVALALAVIAWNEARTTPHIVPAWASTVGMAAGIASFVGWSVGMWIGIRWGNLLWVVSSFLLCLWALWFGVALSRAAGVRESPLSPSGRATAAAAASRSPSP